MKLYKIMFFTSLVLGTLTAISSYSWFTMWIGLEVNLLSMIPLMSQQKNMLSSESSMKYFITQAIASLVLLMSVIMMLIMNEFIAPQMNFYFSLMLNSALLTKLGSAPFHFWFPEVMEGLTWLNCLIMLTWQKIAPMILIMNNSMNQTFMTMVIIACLVVSTIMALNQMSLRKIMTFSSINHIAWMLASTMISYSAWLIYFIIYSFMTASVILNFKQTNSFFMNQLNDSVKFKKLNKMLFMMNFLSLGGLPPFIGFLPKWLIINWMINNSIFTLSFTMILLTMIMLFVYIRMTFSSLLLSTSQSLVNPPQSSKLMTFTSFVTTTSLTLSTMIFNLT